MKHYHSQQDAFWGGVKAIIAMSPGIVPFGAIIGVTAKNMDMNLLEILAMSMGYYAGAAQVASLQLMAEGALLVVVCMTAILICLRFGLYSAALAPHIQDIPRIKRLPLLYALTDQSFNLSIVNYQSGMAPAIAHGYFIGTSVAVWLVWLFAILLGATLGAAIPDTWSLAFFIPLMFISILIPMLRDRALVVAALVAGIVTLMGLGLPFNLGLVLGAFCGIFAGLLTEHFGGKADV